MMALSGYFLKKPLLQSIAVFWAISEHSFLVQNIKKAVSIHFQTAAAYLYLSVIWKKNEYQDREKEPFCFSNRQVQKYLIS